MFDFITRDAHPGSDAPRFDKIRTHVIYTNKAKDRVQKSAASVDPAALRRNPNVKYEGPPLIDTKAFKQAFLKGRGDIVNYCDIAEPKVTSYQGNFKGI